MRVYVDPFLSESSLLGGSLMTRPGDGAGEGGWGFRRREGKEQGDAGGGGVGLGGLGGLGGGEGA